MVFKKLKLELLKRLKTNCKQSVQNIKQYFSKIPILNSLLANYGHSNFQPLKSHQMLPKDVYSHKLPGDLSHNFLMRYIM